MEKFESKSKKLDREVSKVISQSVTNNVIAFAVTSAVGLLAGRTWAGDKIDAAYVKSLAAPGKTVFVVEYYDPAGKVVERKGFASSVGFRATSPVDIEINPKTRVHLYGLKPCNGEMVNRKESFAGTCADFARQELEVMLKAAKVLFCRAFLTEREAPLQDATCFGYYNYPGSLDTVDNLEEQLVSLGALRLAKKPDGVLMRPDLAEAEKIGRGGFGMWADPRVQGQ